MQTTQTWSLVFARVGQLLWTTPLGRSGVQIIHSTEASMEPAEILQTIYSTIHLTNELRPPENQLACAEDSVLYGAGSALDSLGLVSFIMDLEEAINTRFGVQIVLADERAMMEKRNPFRDVAALAAYISRRLAETSPCLTAQ